jgi:hypothetical protein
MLLLSPVCLIITADFALLGLFPEFISTWFWLPFCIISPSTDGNEMESTFKESGSTRLAVPVEATITVSPIGLFGVDGRFV